MFGIVSFKQAHAGALAVQIFMAGFTMLGSSSVPTRKKIKCGRDSAALVTGVPHIGQKVRCRMFPLSAALL